MPSAIQVEIDESSDLFTHHVRADLRSLFAEIQSRRRLAVESFPRLAQKLASKLIEMVLVRVFVGLFAEVGPGMAVALSGLQAGSPHMEES